MLPAKNAFDVQMQCDRSDKDRKYQAAVSLHR